jgi:hypothetical protein
MKRTEQINGFTISLEQCNGLYFAKISPGQLFLKGKRNQETSYIENNAQDARARIQAFKTYAKIN